MRKTILIIDDSGSFRQVVKMALQKACYEVVEAIDGMDACAKLDGRKLNLIVCDVNMPHMDGLTFVKHLKTTSYKFIPVIMLTTESQEVKKAEGRAAGVRAWVTKPFQPSQLVDAVAKLCAA